MRVGATVATLNREEMAKIEIGHTNVSRALACGITVVFLLFVYAVPTLELAYTSRPSWQEGFGPSPSPPPDASSSMLLARYLANREAAQATAAGLVGQVLDVNRVLLGWITRFEDHLDDSSALGRMARPPAQHWLSRWLGVGNEQTYCAREGWLFFRPDVDFLAGPSFLAPEQFAHRRAVASQWTLPPQPDPRPAILDFDRQLRARGITLVVVPTPGKPVVHPEKIARAYGEQSTPLQNPSYEEFVAELQRAGVLVFDFSGALVEARIRSRRPQYLDTDTHWRPEAMERAADALATFVTARVPLPSLPGPEYRGQPATVTNLGDLARMLDLPETQTLYLPEAVSVRRIVSPDGSAWRSSRRADILVLGDSFSNIYSLASLGWGDSAGFVEQVSYTLQRPVDRIVQNDDGAFATRAMLRREVAGGTDRLAGKRVVIWQFAARELAIGDWKLIEIAPPPQP